MFLFLLLFFSSTLFTLTAFASDKPVWTIDYKTLNLPEKGKPVSHAKWATIGTHDKPDPDFHVHLTQDNKILVSFLHYKPQSELEPLNKSKKFDTFFVALLLSTKNGELIRRVEWPLGESTLGQQIGHDSRIYPLPSGDYVGIIDKKLQVLNSSFDVIHDRVLDTLERGKGSYKIIVPLSGKYIVLKQIQSGARFAGIVEIIDSGTFETLERFEQPDFEIVDIWKDRLLSISNDGNDKSRFFEKKIGAFQWDVLGSTQWSILHVLALIDSRRYANPRFIYNGTIIFRDIIEQPSAPTAPKGFFFMIEDGNKNGPFFEGCISKPSWNTPNVACGKSKLSAIRELLDLFAKSWVEIFDLSTRKVLLTTKKSSDMVDYEISPDGNSIIIITQKKIELYTVKSKR